MAPSDERWKHLKRLSGSDERVADGTNEQVAEAVLSDERGEYQFLGLKPGRYRIRCQTRNGYVYYRPSGDTPGAAATELTLGERSYRGINLLVPEIKKGFWKTFSTYDGLPRQNVATVQRAANRLLYVGFASGGLCEFDGREFKEVEGLDIPGAGVPVLARGAKDTPWVGSAGDGLHLLDGKKFRKFTVEQGLASNGIRAILLDRAGMLRVGPHSAFP